MKANEVPEKIHVQPNTHDGWFEGSIPSGLPDGLFVEYTRTDAFIEKACEWWKEEFYYPSMTPEEIKWYKSKINKFRKAMEE